MDHAHLLEALVQLRTRLPRNRKHASVHFRPLRASAPQRFPPGREGEVLLTGTDPRVSFLERNFVNIRLEKTRPAKIV